MPFSHIRKQLRNFSNNRTMNNVFDIKRFGRYFKYDVKNAIAQSGLMLLVLSIAPVLLYLTVGLFSICMGEPWTSTGFIPRCFLAYFALLFFCLAVPSSIYGRLTDRKAGADWLMLPASRLEKFLSMMLLLLVIIPAVTVTLFCSFDALICVIDPSCGKNIIKVITESFFTLDDFFTLHYVVIAALSIMGGLLFYLLGALYFKKHKVAKTILTQICIQMALGFTVLPVITYITGTDLPERWLEQLNPEVHPHNLELLVNSVLHVTIDGTIILLATLVWFRLKTLKH